MDTQSAVELIRRRRSCRTYEPMPVDPETTARLERVLARISEEATRTAGFRMQFLRVPAEKSGSQPGDRDAVRIGTYGTIAGAPAFVIGIMPRGEPRMERFGYAFEQIVLEATALGLGTCWIGGIFDRAGVTASIALADDMFIPIISPVGYPREKPALADILMRKSAGSDRRRHWGELFFDRSPEVPLNPAAAGAYRQPLEMVRLGPSASNKQPWRVVRQDSRFDFHLQRTRGYGLPLYDIQRNDIGIAQCHFELSARELGLAGHWSVEPGLVGESGGGLPDRFEYIASWVIQD